MRKLKEIEKRANEIVKRAKQKSKLIYQLAFVATSDLPESEEAYRMLLEMVKTGMLSEKSLKKIIDQVTRWKVIRYRLENTEREADIEEIVKEIKMELMKKQANVENGDNDGGDTGN
ncbi:MAG: hypothetical protein QXP36_03750 [Conexivisphaerales archaeon]